VGVHLSQGGAGYGLGTTVAGIAAVLFALGCVLQHEAVTTSTTEHGLHLGRLVTQRAWVVGQTSTLLGTLAQVWALGLAPVSIVQPVLAGGLVVALGIRAVRSRCMPLQTELLGAALTGGGLAVFLVAARPAEAAVEHHPPPSAVLAAATVAVLLMALATRLRQGVAGALACGVAAGVAAGIAAVLISVALRVFGDRGLLAGLSSSALWGALVVAVVAQFASQQAYSRGSLSWSLPALVLCDPLAAVPAARVLLWERLEPGHAVVWLPAAVVAAAGVVLLARTGEGCRRPIRFRRPRDQALRTPD
jgi:hypothetical protein